jgi:hypothetical protein
MNKYFAQIIKDHSKMITDFFNKLSPAGKEAEIHKQLSEVGILIEEKKQKQKQKRKAEQEKRNNKPATQNIEVLDIEVQRPKKAQRQERPSYWKEIAEFHYNSNGDVRSTMQEYKEVFEKHTSLQGYHKIKRWARDWRAKREVRRKSRPPSYGYKIDEEVYLKITERIEIGLPIDSYIMRCILVQILKNNGLEHLYEKETSFGESWASRFRKRWKLRHRKVTTKMREVPADFEAKKV